MSTYSIRLGDAAPSRRVERKPQTSAAKPPGPAVRQSLDAAVRQPKHEVGHLGWAVRRVDDRFPKGAALAARADAAEILIAQALSRLRTDFC